MIKPLKPFGSSVLMWQDGKIIEDALRPLSILKEKEFDHQKVVLLYGGTISTLKTSPSLRILRYGA